jgi:hypothetical protein
VLLLRQEGRKFSLITLEKIGLEVEFSVDLAELRVALEDKGDQGHDVVLDEVLLKEQREVSSNALHESLVPGFTNLEEDV